MSEPGWDDYTASSDTAAADADAATTAYNVSTNEDWADWNAATAAEESTAGDSYMAAAANAGDPELAATWEADASNYYSAASDDYATASNYQQTADSYSSQAATDTSGYEASSYDTSSADTSSYDTASYDASE